MDTVEGQSHHLMSEPLSNVSRKHHDGHIFLVGAMLVAVPVLIVFWLVPGWGENLSFAAYVSCGVLAGLVGMALAAHVAKRKSRVASSAPLTFAALTPEARPVSLMQAEGQLLRSGTELLNLEAELVLSVLDDLVTWHDGQGDVVHVSATSGQSFAALKSSLIGEGLFARIHVADRPAFLKAISDVACGQTVFTARLRFDISQPREKAPAGKRRKPFRKPVFRWMDMRVSRLNRPAAFGSGRASVVVLLRDVESHQQEIEDARAETKAMRETVSGRDELIAAIGRDLRGTLDALGNYSRLFATDFLALDPGQRQDYAVLIDESVRHLRTVAEGLNVLSAGDTGRCEENIEPVDFARLARSCCDAIRERAMAKGVTIARDIAPGVPAIAGEGRVFRQIFDSLLSSALDASPQGSKIGVGIGRRVDESGEMLVLQVRNVRCGEGERAIPSVPELGRLVAHGLATSQQADMMVETDHDGGTLVTVQWPLKTIVRNRPFSLLNLPGVDRPRYKEERMKRFA